MTIPILYEDSDLLIIDKPAGVVVNRAESAKGLVIADWAAQRLGLTDTQNEYPDSFGARAGVAHRLDKDTSGVLVIAKTSTSFASIQKQFKDRTVVKKYLALTRGKLAPPQGTIRAPVGRLAWNRYRFGVTPDGKQAETDYTVLKSGTLASTKGDNEPIMLSLLELAPKTGRTHQIRVHLKYLGYPILGDTLYAGRKSGRRDKLLADRLMLHAYSISFRHPVTGMLETWSAPIPSDMKRIVEAME